MAKYTFLLPAYKDQYLNEALSSIANQTYEDFECIVSDDCSPHNLKSIFDETVGLDERFTFRRNRANIGGKSLVAHWNLLVDLCNSEYLIMASDDDYYAPTFLDEVNKLTTGYPSVDLIRGRCNRINYEENIFAEDGICPEFETQADFLYQTYCCNRLKCIANYVFKSNCLKQKGGFIDFPLAWGCDDATVISMTENGVCNTNDVVFSFRCANQNISSDWSKETLSKKLQAKINNLNWFITYKNCFKHNGELVYKTRLRSFENYYIDECVNQIKKHSPMLSLQNACHNFKFLRSNRYFYSRTEILCYWLTWITKNR